MRLRFEVLFEMTSYKFSWVVLHCWVLSLLLFRTHGDGSGISVNFSEAPNSISRLNSTKFSFDVSVDGQKVSVGGNGHPCPSSNITCQLDEGITTDCGGKVVSYTGLHDGNHTFEVCSDASPPVRCSTYNWTVDTVPPTAYITSPSSFTSAMNVSVNISFTEPCTGEDGKDGFNCSSMNACNLLVYGDGQVIPSSLATLVPTRKYTLLVNFSSMVENGSVTLEMDDIFCTDTAGNKFIRAENSSFNITFDRKPVFVNISSVVPEKLRQLDSGNMYLLATNNKEDLKLYLNFSEPVVNSSTEVQNSLTTSEGALEQITGENLGDRTFRFKIVNVPSYAMINISFDSKSIITKYGKPISPVQPVTFRYDSRRLQVELFTMPNRTSQRSIPLWIGFSKPVSGFNKSSILTSGGRLQSFGEIHNSTVYYTEIKADEDVVSVSVPENVTEDIYGNKNQAEYLTVTAASAGNLPGSADSDSDSDSDSILPRVTSTIVTSTFGITCLAHGMLAVSSASLVSTGAISGGSSTLMSDPAGNLFLSLSHIQFIALSRWLLVNLPVEYDEYAKALEWSIPSFNLPLEKEDAHIEVHAKVASDPRDIGLCLNKTVQKKEENSQKAAIFVHTFVPRSTGSNTVSDASKSIRSHYYECQKAKCWKDFKEIMISLAVVLGSVIFLHISLILIVKIRWPQEQGDYGVLTFPRFEIFLILLALPCICKASAGLINAGDKSVVAVGSVLLGVVGLILLSFFLFLLVGVTLGMLFLYDEKLDHQEAQKSDHQEKPKWRIPIGRKWHIRIGCLAQEKPKWCKRIGRFALGPGVEGEWKNKSEKFYLRIFGPLFEDLRGLRYHMLPQSYKGNPLNHLHNKTKDIEASGGSPHKSVDRSIPSNVDIKHVQPPGGDSQKNDDGITASVDETEDTTGPEGNPPKNGDLTITYEEKTGENKHGDFLLNFLGILRTGENKYGYFLLKLLGILRTYYILLESVRQVFLGTLAGAYAHDEDSKTPTIIMLSITFFLLIFLVLLKPFVSKRGLVVEAISIVCEVGVFTLTLLPLKGCSEKERIKVANFMVLLPFIGYSAGMINQCYALYKQIKNLDQTDNKSFVRGLKTASSGFLIFFFLKAMEKVDEYAQNAPGKTASSAGRNGSSTATEEPTKSSSISTEKGNGAPNNTASTGGNPSRPPPSELGR